MSQETSGMSEHSPAPGYEPPRVERVLDAADLEREILYAGRPVPSTDG